MSTIEPAAEREAAAAAARDAWIAARVAEAPPLDARTLRRLRALLPPAEPAAVRSAS